MLVDPLWIFVYTINKPVTQGGKERLNDLNRLFLGKDYWHYPIFYKYYPGWC